ncbi:hypothetical protein D9758_012804 [Tetrapyrgos nigripes]|uniref:ASST-domain-containing protein n=1 Tax=Tetrapyrgos nigripes TaxID=182062 RepID=A0A8H5D062_9AGAR|nr:hypothetical protein D9758_012804 [Tetrapyrgos nigripes]
MSFLLHAFQLLSLTLAVSAQQNPFISRPDLVPTPWNITFTNTSSSTSSGEGFIFMAPRVAAPTGLMIFDNDGNLVYLNNSDVFQNTDGSHSGVFDFRPQRWISSDDGSGKSVNDTFLTLWAGTASVAGFGRGRVFMLDHGYEVVKNFTAVNGSDIHEFHINSDGTAVTTVYNLIEGIDTTSIAQSPLGQEDSFVWDGCAQELDIASGNPTNNFLFCALSSVSPQSTPISVLDSFTAPATPPTDSNNGWDYVHINSAEKDAAGNYLISGRHTHSVYYVDGSTSQIIWALGASTAQADASGPSFPSSHPSNFTGDGNEFSWQHDARWVGEKGLSGDDIRSANSGNTSGPLAGKRLLTVYDNASAGFASSGTESRGLLIQLDFSQSPWTASIITSYHSPGGESTLLSASQGNLQFLSEHPELGSDNVFMSYGNLPVFAEYTREGDPIRVVHYGNSGAAQGYRIFRAMWDGTPVSRPDVGVDADAGMVYVSWNGATRVVKWRLTQGDDASSLSSGNETNVDKQGFETAIAIDTTPEVLQVSALDKDGNVLAKSNVVSVKDGSVVGEGQDGVKANSSTDASAGNNGTGTSGGGGDDNAGVSVRMMGMRVSGTTLVWGMTIVVMIGGMVL